MRGTVLMVGGVLLILGGTVLLLSMGVALWRGAPAMAALGSLLGAAGSTALGWRAVKRGRRERRLR